MACNFVEGQIISCNDGVAGAVAAWVTEFANVTAMTVTSGTITSLTQAASTKFWRIDVPPENMNFIQNSASGANVPNMTSQKLNWTQLKHTARMRDFNATMLQNRLMVLILDANGTYQMMGATKGAYVPTLDTTTGKALNEFSGSTYNLEAREPFEAYYVSSSVISGLSFGQ